MNVDADAATTSELDAGDGGPDADAADPVDATVDPGPCNARVEVAPILESPHVADGTPIVYAANPPSSGPHYNSWANFQELTRPVDDGYLVHSLEHGGVLLLHACAPGPACDAIVSGLRSVRDAIPTDPSCSPAIRVRAVIASRAANTSAVHVVAWGHVYRADCVDPPSIASFIAAHYAKGPEDICIQGQVF